MTEGLRAIEEEIADAPRNPEAFSEFADRFWQQDDWQSVVGLYEHFAGESADFVDFTVLIDRLRDHAEAVDSESERRRIFTEIGDLYRRRLGDVDESIQAYRTAFGADGADPAPLRRACRTAVEEERWELLEGLYRDRLEATDDPNECTQLLLQLAQVQADRLGRFGAALETLEQIDDADGEDEWLHEQLSDFYRREMTLEAAIDEALDLAEMGLNDEDAELAAESFSDAARLEAARVGGDLEEALRLAEQAADADAGDAEQLVERLEQRLDEQHADSSVNGGQGAAVVADAVDEQPPSEEATEETHAEEHPDEQPDDSELEDLDRIERFYAEIEPFDGTADEARDALEDDRTDLSALKTVRADLLERGDLAGLAEVLEGSERYFRKKEGGWELMTELANLYWLELGDDDQAEYYFKRLKLRDETHPDVFKFYEAYHEDEGNWRKLSNLLADRFDQIDDREQKRLLTERIAEIAEFELNTPQRAIRAWSDFLEQFPGDEHARSQLRDLYEDHGKWNALVDMLKKRDRQLADEQGDEAVDERLALLEEIARIYRDEMGHDRMVMKVMSDILQLDPDHPQAFRQLRELYEDNRRFKDLAELLATTAERAAENGSIGTAVDRLLEAADIWENRQRNQTEAIPHLERIVELSPREQQVRKRLRDIYESRRDFESLFDLRLKETELIEGPERAEQLEELLEMAENELRDRPRQARVLEQLVQLQPDDLELLDDLEQAYRDLEDVHRLAGLLEQRAEKIGDDDAIEALEEAAGLYQKTLENEDEAIRLWHRVLSERPEHSGAFEALSALYTDRHDYDELEALYTDTDRPEPLFKLLGALADRRPEEALSLQRRRARLADERLDDPHRVIEALEALVQLVDAPDEVRRELLEWYDRIGDVDSEIDTRDALLESADDEESFEQLMTIVGLEQTRERTDAAMARAVQAFELIPQRFEAFERAEQLARECRMLDALVTSAEQVAEQLDDDALRDRILTACARLQHRELEAYEEATERYEQLRERHPEDLEILDALEALYDVTDRPEHRMEVLETQIELLRTEGADDADVVDQLSKIADIQRTHFDEPESARKTYYEILDLQPEHLGAIRGIKQLYRDDEQWMEVVDYLLREIPLAGYESDQQQWEAKFELAEVYRQHLDDPQEALHHYGEILGENPEYDPALQAVRTLLAEDDLAREAALLLEPIFRDLDKPRRLAEALEARLRVCEDPYEEQEILDELIPLYDEQLEEHEQAFEYARRQFEFDPERDDIWLQFEQIGAKLNRWELIEEMFTDQSPLEGHDSPVRYDLLRHLAAIREHRLQQPQRALEAWKELHEYDPFDEPTLEALERLHRQLDNPERLVDVLRERSELVEIDEDRVELLVEAGDLLADQLDEPVEATDVFRQVLSFEPEHTHAVDRLRKLYRQQQRWHDLEALLSRQADETLDPDRRRELHDAVARVRYNQLGDTPGAVTIVCELLDDDPGDDEIVEFARQVDSELAEQQPGSPLRLQLVETLEPVYRMRGEYERLDEVLQVRLEAAGEFEQIEILDELVELRDERLADPEAAFEALGETVVLAPDDEQRRERLVQRAESVDRIEQAADILEEAAEAADPFAALPLWKQLGGLTARQLRDSERAIECYDRALQVDEADLEVLVAQEELFEAVGDSARLCENLRDQAQLADPDERVELLRRVATLEEHVLERPLDAIDTHRQLLELQPEDLAAVEALQRLYEQEQQHFELVDILQRKAELVDEPQRIDVFEHLADVAEQQLDDPDQAIDVYRRILEQRPDHTDALEQLDRLYEQQHQWSDWLDVARRRLEGPAGDDPDSWLDLQVRTARVLVEELYEIEEAIEVYRSILERDRTQQDAVEALESLAERDNWLEEVATDLVEVYRRSQRWEDLVQLYERRSERAMDPGEQAQFDFERGTVLRDQLEDVEEAMHAFAAAWKCELEDERYRRGLVQLGTSEEAWDPLVELLEEVLEQAVDPELTRELHLMVARLYDGMLDDAARAEDHLREVLSAHPGDDEAHATLRGLLEQQQRWLDLVDLLEDRVDAVLGDDESQAVQLLFEIAEVQHDRLDDEFAAVDTLQRLRRIAPRHAEAKQRLETLLEQQERWNDLAAFYERIIDETEVPSERLEADLALAELCRGPLDQPDRAVELYGQVLDIDAEHQKAVEALEEVFENHEQFRADAAELLEPIYRARGEDESLAKVLQARADDADEPDKRVALLRELLELLDEAVAQPRRAWATAARLFILQPDDDPVRRRLWELTARADGWEQLAEVYRTTLEDNLEIDDTTRARLHLGLAEIYADRLDEPDRGLEAAQQARRIAPEDDRAADAIERLLERRRDWSELADFYRERANLAADEQQQCHWYEKLAALHEEVLGDVDAVVDVYARLLEIAPGEEDYRRAMERILTTTQRWYDLADIYRQRIAGTTDEAVEIHNRLALAGVLERELGEVDGAVDQYRSVLELDPDDSDAIRGLEGLRRDLENRSEEFKPLRKTIIDVLLDTYDHAESWRRVDDLFEQRAELLDAPGEKVETLVDKAELLLSATDDDIERVQALTDLVQAFCLDPTNEQFDDTIEALAEDLDAWQRIIPQYLKALEQTDDADRQGHILAAVARIYEEHIGDTESAVAAYHQSVEISTESDLAFEKLEQLYGEMEKWEPLVEILERRLGDIYDAERQHQLRERIARIYDQQLGQPHRAIEMYNQLRQDQPGELSHLVVLQRLYESVGDWESLEELLEDKLQLVDDDALCAEVLGRLGEIRREFLDDVNGAIAAYGDAIEVADAPDAPREALIELLRSEQRWHELLDVLRRDRDHTADPEEQNRLDVQMGDILSEHLQDPPAAFERYLEALRRNPDDYAARGAMLRLIENDEVRRDAAEVLAESYESSGEFEELEAVYQRVVEHAEDPEYLAEQYLELAKLQYDQIGMPMKAFATLGDAVADVPASNTLRVELEALAKQLDSTADLVPLYEDILQQGVDDPEARRQLHKTVGRAYAEAKGDADTAVEHFEAVLEVDEYDRDALSWLDRIYQGRKDWPNLARILERKIEIVEGEELTQATFQLGYLREVAYEDEPEALELYRQVLEAEPDHKGAIQGLERLADQPELRGEVLELLEPVYRRDGDWAKLARLFELKLEVIDDPFDRAELLRQLADVEHEQLERVHVAFQHRGEALVEQPQNDEIRERLEDIATVHSLTEELVDIYQDVIEADDDPLHRLEVAERGGELALDELEDPTRAAVFFRAVLEVDPEHEQALELLEDVARSEGDDESLAAVLAARMESTYDEQKLLELCEELASVRLGIPDYEGASEAFEKLLELDGENLERLETLAELYEHTEQFEKRVDTLERILPYREDDLLRHETLVEMGTICADELDDARRAREYFEQALDIDPTDRPVARRLEEIYEQLEDFDALEALLGRQLDSVDEADEDERLRLRLRRAELRDDTGDIVGATDDYRAAFELQRNHPTVLDRLDELYREQQQYEPLLDLIATRIELSDDPEQIAGSYLEMAQIADEQLGASDRAVEFAESALQVDPADEAALDRLESIHRRRDDYEGVVHILDRRIQTAEDDERRVELLGERARTLHEDADQLREAAESYRQLLEYSPGDEQLLDTLAEIYEQIGDGEKLYELLAWRADEAGDDERRAELLLEMADVADQFLGGGPPRVDALEEVRQIRGDDLEVVEPLLDAYIDADELDRAEPLLESVIETLSDQRKMKEVVRFLHLRGKLAEQRGDAAAAREAYEEAHRIDSTYIPNLLSLGKFLFEQQEFEEAKKIYQILLLHQMNIDDDADKVQLYFHLGAVREQLGEKRGARDMYKRALRVDPDNQTVKAAMEALE